MTGLWSLWAESYIVLLAHRDAKNDRPMSREPTNCENFSATSNATLGNWRTVSMVNRTVSVGLKSASGNGFRSV
jgi:hypothetical protein